MGNPSPERIEELQALVIETLNDDEYFNPHQWDASIECDERLTDEELEWMRSNFEVVVSIQRKDN